MKKQIQISSVLRNFLGCFVILIFLIPSIGKGQTTVSYTAMTTITFPATPVATIAPTVSGLTFSQLSRGTGVLTGAAAGCISGSGFNGTLAANITANKWYTFSITCNASTTFTVSALSIVSRVSTVLAGNNVSVQYSIGGSTPTNVIGSYTPTSSAATYPITPSSPIAVGANQVLNIYIIPNGLSASGTTCRVENNTSVTVSATPVTTLATEPTTQADPITFSNVGSTTMTVGWTNGNGNRSAVFMKETAGTITNPTDGVAYTASSDWSAKGTQLGTSGYYCIYDGTGTSVALTNLAVNTNYVVQVFSYNADSASAPTASTINYLTSTGISNPNNQTTASPLLGTSPGTAITGLTYYLGSGPSNESSTFRIGGTNLTTASGNLTVTPSSNIEVYDGTTWQAAAFTVPYTSFNITTSFIYKVRLKAGLAIASYASEYVVVSGGGAPLTSLMVSGSVVGMPLISTTPSSYSGLTYIEGAGPSSASATFAINANYLLPASGNVTLTPSTNIEIYDGTTWQSAAFTVAYTAGTLSTSSIYQVRLKAGLTSGAYASEYVAIFGGGASVYSLLISGSVTSANSPVCPSGTSISGGTQTICQGATASSMSATLSYVGNTGTPTLAYQWYYNTTNSNTISGATAITGATAASYTPLTTASEVGTRYYFCVGYATDVACSVSATTQYLASNAVSVTVYPTPATPTASNNGPVCEGSALSLSTPAVTGATYSWTGPNSFTAATQNPVVNAASTTAMAGNYYVTIAVNGCSSATSAATAAVVNTIPATPTASNNGTVCTGETLTLSTPTVSGATYAWTGPNAFTSSSQNPTVSASATTAMAGAYNVTVTVSGCTSAAATTTAAVNSALVPGSVSGIVLPTYGTSLVISQVYGGGGNAGSVYTNDFIEIYNPTAATVNLSGWAVQYTSAAGTSWSTTPLTGSIAPGKYYLIQEAAGTGGTTSLPTPDATGTIAMGAAAFKVALTNTTTALSGAIATGAGAGIVDFIGCGTANGFETAVAPAPSATASLLRVNNGCTDANNNSTDFVAGTVAPRNSASPTNTCSVTNYTESICAGSTPTAASVAAASGSTGTYTYQWYSYNGITTPTATPATSSWTAENTGLNLTTSALTQSKTYACYVTPVGCGVGAWAPNYRQVTVNALPSAPTITASGSTSIENGGSVTLTASSGTTYLWSNGATTSSITVSTAGNYTVQVINASGCISFASSVVTVNVVPSVTTTTPVSNLTVTSATLSGNVTNTGAAAITATGIVYALTSTNATPTIGGSGVVQLSTASPNASTGAFSENTIAALSPSTNYSYRAYAISSQGTSYGAVATFTTLSYSPSVVVTSSNPSFGSVCTTGASNFATASFTFNGIYLDGTNLTISSTSSELTFSTSQNGTYVSSLAISAGATLTGQVVWVKFIPTATGAFNGSVAISGGGLSTTVSVPTTATGINTPVVTTTGASSSITSTGASLAGSYTAGCSAITASGIEYSLSNTFSTSTTVSGLPAVVSGLAPNTVYYYRAYATDATGTVNGTTLSFTTLNLSAPLAVTANPISYDSFTANWNAVAAATSYQLDVSAYANFLAPTYSPIASWTFPTSGLTLTADVVNANNTGVLISTNGGTPADAAGASTRATTVNAWQTGAGSKYWSVTVNTTGLYAIHVKSAQYSSNTGPKDFKLQYQVGAGGWNDVTGGSITVGANFTSGVANVTLPAACDNQSAVAVRWLMNSNTSVNNGTVASGGTNRIDDIVIEGYAPSYISGYANLTVNGTSQNVTGLAALTNYYYRVRAVSANSTSPNSNAIPVTTTALPATFGGVSVSNTPVCASAAYPISVSGLLPNSTSTVSYTLNYGSVQTATGVVADASGNATFNLNLSYSNNGQTLAITQIERTDITSPILTVSANNTVTLSLNPTSAATLITANTAVCSGTGITLTLAGVSGTIQWQQSADGSTGWTDISGATATTYATGNLTATTYYRAVATSGVCPSYTTNSVRVQVNAFVTYYADADHDGYGNAAVTQSSCMGAPAGYVANSTDCDDTRATTNPGAVDICNDGIDNDCNGTIDNVGMPGGCAPTVSNVIPSQCGTTLNLLDDQIYAAQIANAQGYRWKVTNLTTNQVQMRDTSFRTLKLTQLASYAFNTTYQIEVAVKINNNWQPYYGSACNITTPATTTTIVSTQCGTQLGLMTDVVYANLVTYATGYRFKVTNLSTNAVQTIDRSLREFRFNLLSNIPYNTLYKVEVAVKNTDGTYLPYGPSCNVTTPLFPTTSLQDSQCDYVAASNNELVYAKLVANATNYRFNFTNTALSYGYTFDTVLRVFALNTVPGLTPNTTYSVKVAVKIGGVWGPYNKVCTLTTPGTVKPSTAVTSESNFDASAYPNPFAANFKLNVNTNSDEALQVKVYDMLGKLIENSVINPIEVRAFEVGNNYPTGVYNVIVSQGDQFKTLRVVKR
jgi:hypothetical protein